MSKLQQVLFDVGTKRAVEFANTLRHGDCRTARRICGAIIREWVIQQRKQQQ